MSVTLNMQRAHDRFRSRSFSDRTGIGRKRFRRHIFAPWHNPGVVHFRMNLNFAPDVLCLPITFGLADLNVWHSLSLLEERVFCFLSGGTISLPYRPLNSFPSSRVANQSPQTSLIVPPPSHRAYGV